MKVTKKTMLLPGAIAKSADGKVKVMSARPTSGETLTTKSGITLCGSGLGRKGALGITTVSGDIDYSTDWRIVSQADDKLEIALLSTATPPGTYDFELMLEYTMSEMSFETVYVPLKIEVVE